MVQTTVLPLVSHRQSLCESCDPCLSPLCEYRELCDPCLSPLCEYSTGTYDSLCDPLLCVIIYIVCYSGDHNDIFKTYMIYFYVYVYCLTCYVKW